MTQRTKIALAVLLADNTSGGITPSVLRDLLESVAPSHGGFHFNAAIETGINLAETFVKAANTSVLDVGFRFSMPGNNRLQYTGLEDVRAYVTASLSFVSEDDSQVIAFGIALNGTVIDSSIVRMAIATGVNPLAVTLLANLVLSPDDYLEVWTANDTSDTDVTIELGTMSAIAHLI